MNILFANDRFNSSDSAISLHFGSLDLPSNRIYFDGRDFTIASWINVQSLASFSSRLVDCASIASSLANSVIVSLQNGFDKLAFFQTSVNGNKTRATSSRALETHVWSHLAVTLSSTTGSIFVNAQLTGRSEHMTSPRIVGHCFIGKSQLGYDSSLAIALVDDLMFFNKALEQPQIDTLVYNRATTTNTTNSTSNLVVTYAPYRRVLCTFNQDTQCSDNSTRNQSTMSFVSDRAGASSSAIRLINGATFTLPTIRSVGGGVALVSLWFARNSSFSSSPLVVFECPRLAVKLLVNGSLCLSSMVGNQTNQSSQIIIGRISANTWTHLAVSVGSGDRLVTTYVNGLKTSSSTQQTTFSFANVTCTLGGGGSGELLFDDVAFYDNVPLLNGSACAWAAMNAYWPISHAQLLKSIGAVHAWPFTGQSRLSDVIGGGQELLLVGGGGGRALFGPDRFEAVNGSLLISTSAALMLPVPDWLDSTQGEFTIAVWVLMVSMEGAESRVLDCGTRTPGEANVVLALQEQKTRIPYFAVWNAGVQSSVHMSQKLALNVWFHFAVTMSARGTNATIYTNLIAKAASANMHAPRTQIARTQCYIGKSNWAADGPTTAYFQDLIIFNKALDHSQLQTISISN